MKQLQHQDSEQFPIDWDLRTEQSELAYFKGYGGVPREYPCFTHIHNPHVLLAGDYNLATQVKLTDHSSFDRLVEAVEQIHRDKDLDKPTCYYCSPPCLDDDKWSEYLMQRGFELEHSLYFCASTSDIRPAPGFHLYQPAIEEFDHWYHERKRLQGGFTEAWYKAIRPAQIGLIRTFKPFWLKQDDRLLGWLYCADLGDYCRLHDVNILSQYRRHGYGTIMLNLIRKKAATRGASHILISTYDRERLTMFYKNAGFNECSRSSVIRRKAHS